MFGIPVYKKNPNENFIEAFQNNNLESNPVVLVDNEKNQIKINGVPKFTNICPHAGCPLRYNSDKKKFICPCHNSQFNLEGNCIKGPACPQNIRL